LQNSRHPALERGAFRDRHGRWARDAVDAAALARGGDRRAGFVCERFTSETNDVVADGEAVWSWHPLLVSSWRRLRRPDRVRQNLNPPMTVTKRIRRRGEHEISR
jgi:hypothetical protein